MQETNDIYSESPITILLVDDSPSDRLIFRRALLQNTDQSYQFIEAETVAEALTVIEQESPDCILLDYDLPDANGVDLLNTITQSYGQNTFPVVMLSGTGTTETVVKTISLGAQDFLVKDKLNPVDLLRAINNAIEKVRLYKEKKEALRSLNQSEERYRTLFESMDEGFCLLEMFFDVGGKPNNYRFLEINPAFEKLSGISSAEALSGKLVTELIPGIEEKWFSIYGRILQNGVPERFVEKSENSNRWFEIYSQPVGLPENNQLVVLFSDITARKNAEIEREESRRQAEEANRLKDEFLATLSHELRTPLSSILGWSKILLSRELDPEQTKKAILTIERNAQAQTQLVEDILDISRIITGKLRLDVRSVDLSKVIAAAADTVRLAAEAKNIRLQTLLDPKVDSLSGDSERLQQVIWNLLSNAVKFTPKGGRIQVRLERINSHVEIVVSDTGKGIEPDFLPHVFDRFRQSDGSMTRRHGGLGLGLAIVSQIVELHGGTVSVRSDGLGQGASFTITLPLLPLRTEPVGELERVHPSVSTEAAETSLNEPQYKFLGTDILVVDDEADSRDLLKLAFETYQANVITANSAAEAYLLVQQQEFDIIISDIGMPEEDGFSLIRKIRQLPDKAVSRVPMIALTAYARPEDRIRALQSGFQTHIAKPVNLAELAAIVANLTGQIKF